MKQSEALDMITKLRLAQQAMESACKRIDELKEENKNLKEALAKQEGQSNFCPNCEALSCELKAIKQEQGEPEAWMHPDGRIWTFGRGFDKSTFTIPLYTTPQPAQKPWVGLMDEEIWTVLQFRGYSKDNIEIAKAIEDKLKGKNT